MFERKLRVGVICCADTIDKLYITFSSVIEDSTHIIWKNGAISRDPDHSSSTPFKEHRLAKTIILFYTEV